MTAFKPVDPRQSFPDLEQSVLERWRARAVFERSMERRAEAPVWSFYEGPPTANGRPGSHHVLSRVFKDIYPRYRSMTGYHVPRKGGWDCHGLPVELEVEKELGISSKQEIEEYGIAEFNARCRESVFEYVGDWNRLTERIGFWLDLDDAYFTLHDDYIESVWWSLRRLWDEGMLYEGHRVSPYCPRCGTALSSHEVALGYEEVDDPSIYVRLEPTGDHGPVQSTDRLLIWTTTPWTLPGNYAVAVGPDIEYVRARAPAGEAPSTAGDGRGGGAATSGDGGEVLILAAALVERVLGEGAEVLDRFPGSELIGAGYRGPIFRLQDREPGGFPVIGGGFVTTEDGTGLVHLAPAYGEDDYAAIVAAGLYDPTSGEAALYNPVDAQGNFDSRVIGFEGRFVKDEVVTSTLIADLERRGMLLRSEVYTHSYPHCWRCATPLLYYAKSSWYIATSRVRERLLANNEQIDWHPSHIKHGRFGKWLESNVDWALSRDRYWGTPLPIWICGAPDCEERFCAGSVAELAERARGEVPSDLHRPYIDELTLDCDRCGGEMRRVESVIDTWYDSGAMPFAQHHYPFENEDLFGERFPADFICEAIDQTRGWFYTLLAESSMLFDRPAYLNCVCLGLLLDADGQKMSKSRGNVIEPWEVIDEHGADAFRWYLFTAQQPWTGYRFSVEGVGESLRQFLLTFWNTYSFWVMYANAEGVAPQELPDLPEAGEPLDRWALSRLQSTVASVRERMDGFDCTTAGREIAAYIEELSNWYVRLSRRRFWDGDRQALATLRHCLLEVAALVAPFTPFLADEIHLNLAHGAAGFEGEAEPPEAGTGPRAATGPRAQTDDASARGALPDSVHLRDYPEPSPALTDAALEAEMAAVRRTVELGRAARAQAKAKVRQPLRRAVVVASDAERESISRHGDLVRGELNVKELEFVAEEGELVRYRVKPNYRSLGPRFGSQMPQAAAAVEALDATHVAEALEAGREVGISIEGHDHSLREEDVNLILEPLEGYQVEAEAGHAVALSLELDEELRQEGLAREIVHVVQNARKAAGFEITDRIELALDGDTVLLTAAGEHFDYITDETLAVSLGLGEDSLLPGMGRQGDGTAEAHTSESSIEGRPLTVSLSRSR